MSNDKNEIVPSENDKNSSWEKWFADYKTKTNNDSQQTNYTSGEKTIDIKINQIINLLWTINERLDRIEEALNSLNTTTDDTYSLVDDIYDEYIGYETF